MEKIIQIKTCKLCQTKFNITDSDLEFYDKISPSFWWKKYKMPTPTLCPDCRQQRRISFRNEKNLYKRKCDETNKNIISIYSPDKPFKIYDQEYRWSDKWDKMEYYLDINFQEEIFKQFMKLKILMPKRALIRWTGSENSDYTNWVWASKNSYLLFDSTDVEDCYYLNTVTFSSDCVDFS